MQRFLLTTILSVLAFCGTQEGPVRREGTLGTWRPDGMRRVAAVVTHYGDGPVVELPASGRSGEPLGMRVTTYGGGCTREDKTVVSIEGLTATVRPYQLEPRPSENMDCKADLLINVRPVVLKFATSGQATVRIHGRAAPGDSAVVITRAIDID